MAETILQLWESTKINNVRLRNDLSPLTKGFNLNKAFITNNQISNWEDFTKRSIAPDRDNPSVQLNNTWAPEGKTYFGDIPD
tara:strand:+ start:303 stop:548 length:246 start_codon:yes stop_codon:yes gene_type:complete